MTSGLIIFLALLGGAVFLLSQVLIVPAFGSDARTRRLLRRKLAEIDAVDAEREVASLLRQKYLRELSPLARRLEDSPHMEALGRHIEQAGLPILAHRLVLLSLLLAVAASLADHGLHRQSCPGACLPLLRAGPRPSCTCFACAARASRSSRSSCPMRSTS